jgi:NitT/TauT family transport system permease protein
MKQNHLWFSIRKELSPGRNRLMTALSFLAPLAIWSLVSYTPFFWHPDVKLQISAERDDVPTVFTFGDHLSKAFFPTFQEAVRTANESILEWHQTNPQPTESPRIIRRSNLKKLRHLGPLAIQKGWINREEAKEDAVIHQLWLDMAAGVHPKADRVLSEENREVIQFNTKILARYGSSFSVSTLPDVPLLSLVPQGVSANPSYLPAPHEVFRAGYRLFVDGEASDNARMRERLVHSLRIVLGGFLLSCLIGVPLGILCGTFGIVSRLFEPFVDFFRYMPAPAFSTLLVAIFSAHDAPKIALVFIGTFFQMVLVVSNTTRQLDLSLLEAAQTLGAKSRHLLWKVTIPGILPNLYNDLRILLGWSWTWLVIAELIGVKSGLTEFIETQGRWRNFDQVYPVIMLIGVIGFGSDQLLSRLSRTFFPYLNHNTREPGMLARMQHWATADRIDTLAERRAQKP